MAVVPAHAPGVVNVIVTNPADRVTSRRSPGSGARPCAPHRPLPAPGAGFDAADDWIAERAGPSRLWNNEFQFGDWVDPTVDPHTPGSARTDPGFVATAYFARSTRDAAVEILSRLAAEHGL